MKTAIQPTAAGLLVLTLGAFCLADSAPGQGQAVKLETLPWEEFQKLPGTATVQFQGRSLTKDQFLVEVRQKKSRSSPGPRAGADLAKEFEQKEKARIAAKNARMRASRSLSGIPAGKVVCLSPRIESLEITNDPWSDGPTIEPGQRLRLNGCGFGRFEWEHEQDSDPWPGIVKLFGVFSGGSLTLNRVIQPHASWEDNSIVVEVPPSVSGVPDQNLVQIQVVLKSGKKSNLWQTSFRAAREEKVIPFSELQVTCAKPGAGSFCMASPDPWFSAGDSAFVQHTNPGLSFGRDKYAVSVTNGWEVDKFGFGFKDATDEFQPCIGYADAVDAQSGANARIDVVWLEYETSCPVRYYLQVLATGPKGIPYK